MKIYIETVVILNFLLDYMILYGTKKTLRRNVSNKKLILGSILASTTVVLIKINMTNIELIIIKILFSIIINRITFGKEELLKNILYFYMISIILGGTIYLLNINHSYYINYLLLLILTPVIIKLFVKEYKKYKESSHKTYQVTIESMNKVYQYEAFIDTGNRIKSPISNKSIILIDKDIPSKKSYYITYKALNYEGLLECIIPDKIIINQKEIKSCLIGISKEKLKVDGYHCILPNSLKEEL